MSGRYVLLCIWASNCCDNLWIYESLKFFSTALNSKALLTYHVYWSMARRIFHTTVEQLYEQLLWRNWLFYLYNLLWVGQHNRWHFDRTRFVAEKQVPLLYGYWQCLNHSLKSVHQSRCSIDGCGPVSDDLSFQNVSVGKDPNSGGAINLGSRTMESHACVLS